MDKSSQTSRRGRPRISSGLRGGWCGHALRARMATSRITAAQLAALLGVSRPAVSAWVCERSEPSPHHVARLAELFACEPSCFSIHPKIAQR